MSGRPPWVTLACDVTAGKHPHAQRDDLPNQRLAEGEWIAQPFVDTSQPFTMAETELLDEQQAVDGRVQDCGGQASDRPGAQGGGRRQPVGVTTHSLYAWVRQFRVREPRRTRRPHDRAERSTPSTNRFMRAPIDRCWSFASDSGVFTRPRPLLPVATSTATCSPHPPSRCSGHPPAATWRRCRTSHGCRGIRTSSVVDRARGYVPNGRSSRLLTTSAGMSPQRPAGAGQGFAACSKAGREHDVHRQADGLS